MKSMMVFLAAQELRGGIKGADGEADVPHVTAAGTELTRAEANKLGLSDEDVEGLIASGAVVRTSVRSEGESLGDVDVADGISVDEFREFLADHGYSFARDASIEDLLALDRPVADGIGLGDLRATLELNGIDFPSDASAERLLELAIEHGKPGDLDAAANRIQRDMGVDDIKEELGKLQVPFETDANKPALAKLLAQVRASGAKPA